METDRVFMVCGYCEKEYDTCVMCGTKLTDIAVVNGCRWCSIICFLKCQKEWFLYDWTFKPQKRSCSLDCQRKANNGEHDPVKLKAKSIFRNTHKNCQDCGVSEAEKKLGIHYTKDITSASVDDHLKVMSRVCWKCKCRRNRVENSGESESLETRLTNVGKLKKCVFCKEPETHDNLIVPRLNSILPTENDVGNPKYYDWMHIKCFWNLVIHCKYSLKSKALWKKNKA